jgi:hypothetical protein
MKANSKLMPKVFKWTKKKTAKNSHLKLTKKHQIKPISTRKYYTGRHEIHLQINGKLMAKVYFFLTV